MNPADNALDAALSAGPTTRKKQPGALRFLGRLMRIRGAGIGLVLITITALAAIAAPIVAPYDPTKVDVNALLADPSSAHALGTDQLGRDLLSRLIYGARISLIVGLISVTVAAGVGVPVGLVAGYAGGLVDSVLMRIM